MTGKQSGERRIVKAPEHIREAVHEILVGHMAGHLLAHRVDLGDRGACRVALIAAGFGEASVETLLGRAVVSAAVSKGGEI